VAALPNFAGETSRRRETVRDWGRPALRSPPCYAHRLATAGKPELRAFGEHRYGERAAVVESEDWEGPELGACMNAASVCRSIETSRRREVLSFSHHAEVAALPVKQQEKLLDRAEAEGMSTRNLRAEVAQTRAALHSQELSRRVTASLGSLERSRWTRRGRWKRFCGTCARTRSRATTRRTRAPRQSWFLFLNFYFNAKFNG
jgi:hypothetical protein